MKKLLLVALLTAVCGCSNGRDYPEETRKAFVGGCVAGVEAKAARCSCILEDIEEAYTHEEFAEVEIGMAAGKPMPIKLAAIVASCKATVKYE